MPRKRMKIMRRYRGVRVWLEQRTNGNYCASMSVPLKDKEGWEIARSVTASTRDRAWKLLFTCAKKEGCPEEALRAAGTAVHDIEQSGVLFRRILYIIRGV